MNNMIRYSLMGFILASFGWTSNAVAADYWQNQSLDSVSVSSASSFMAQRLGDDEDRGYKGEKSERLMKKLNLTSEQRNKIADIRSKYQPKFDSLNEQIRNEREILGEMMRTNQGENQMRSQHQKIVSLSQQIQNLRFESMLEMREVLTPEQRQEWANMMGKGRMSHGGRNR